MTAMNLEFYKLRRQPFGDHLIRQVLVFWRFTQQAFSALLSAVQERRGFQALIAKPAWKNVPDLQAALNYSKTPANGILFSELMEILEKSFLLAAGFEAEPAGEDWPSMQKSLNAALMRESLRIGRFCPCTTRRRT